MRKPQLFLLHFAGGNYYSFQHMLPFLKNFEVIPLELPGRGKRMREPLLKEFDLAAGDIFYQLTARLSAPVFMIYGHSMGAGLAWRVAAMLEKSGRQPHGIIVSGNAGPGIKSSTDKKTHLLEKKEFIEELERLGGVPAEVIENEELFSLFEPVLRADFEIADEGKMLDEPAIQAPIHAIMGSLEKDVQDINNWARFTKSTFNATVLEGDHFFINKHSRQMANIIDASFERSPGTLYSC